MTRCQRCRSNKVVYVQAKCSDRFSLFHNPPDDGTPIDYEGYVPMYMGIGGGDYVEFGYCLNCGQIQGDFPIEMPTDLD